MALRIRTEYEWIVEHVDDSEEIVDVLHFPTFVETLADDTQGSRIALVRYQVEYDGEGHEDEVSRSYWYLTEDGTLSGQPTFEDGVKVPERFVREAGL